MSKNAPDHLAQREPTPDERRKADRALIILYIAMAVLTALPLLALWWMSRSR